MTLSDFLNDLKNKFAPPPVYVPPYRPPVAVRPPAPIAIPPNAPTAIEQQPQPQAALTSSVDHSRGRGHTGSLISGR